ncbi:MAG: nuclear transport factor 2 family protein [Nocardioidaceae bacterium]
MSVARPEQVARTLFEAYAAGDLATMRGCLADDLVGWITNRDGGVGRTDGADAYLSRLPDLSEAELEVGITQVLGIDDERAMVMVAIRATRHGKDLHNYAAFLARVEDGRVVELWMVEAQPAYSDEFWS